MNIAGNKPGRPNRLDLYRFAAVLGVTPGHLSRVISGKRESRALLIRWQALTESESQPGNQPKSSTRK